MQLMMREKYPRRNTAFGLNNRGNGDDSHVASRSNISALYFFFARREEIPAASAVPALS